MAHIKLDIVVKNVEGPIKVEQFEVHIDTQYSTEEVVAVMGALPEYMADLIKVVEASNKAGL